MKSPPLPSVKAAVAAGIRGLDDPLVLPEDFTNLAVDDELTNILCELCGEQVIVEIAEDVYARVAYSKIWGKVLPEEPVATTAARYAQRMGARIVPTEYERANLDGYSNQVSTGAVVGVDRPIDKTFGLGGIQGVWFEVVPPELVRSFTPSPLRVRAQRAMNRSLERGQQCD